MQNLSKINSYELIKQLSQNNAVGHNAHHHRYCAVSMHRSVPSEPVLSVSSGTHLLQLNGGPGSRRVRAGPV